MLNMMKLDWLSMKGFYNRLLINLAAAIFVGVVSEGEILIPFTVFCMYEFASYMFDAEEKGKLNHLYLALPVSRKTIVSAKYGFSLAMQFIGIVAGVVMTLAFSAVLRSDIVPNPPAFRPGFENMALLSCVGLLLCAFLSLLSYPLIIKLGYAKAKIFGWYLPTIAGGALLAILVNAYNHSASFRGFANSTFGWAFANTALTALVMLGAAAALNALSYALSLKAYAKREF